MPEIPDHKNRPFGPESPETRRGWYGLVEWASGGGSGALLLDFWRGLIHTRGAEVYDPFPADVYVVTKGSFEDPRAVTVDIKDEDFAIFAIEVSSVQNPYGL